MTAMLTMPAERAMLRRLVSGAGEATESSALVINIVKDMCRRLFSLRQHEARGESI